MKKCFYLLLLPFIAFSMHAEVQNYKVEVGQFDKIKVQDNVNVVYRCLPDSTGFVQYSGDKEFADAFIITPKTDGTLRIQVSTEDVDNPHLPTLYIYSDFLTSVVNASSFSVLIENPAPCAEFKALQIGNGSISVENVKTNKLLATLNTGNGTVNISGSAVTAILKMVGTGVISADRLRADDVQCKILGSGSIGCWPESKLAVKGIGSTKIYYKGDPKIKKAGGGKLFPLPEGRPVDTVIVEEIAMDIDNEELVDSDTNHSDDLISDTDNNQYDYDDQEVEGTNVVEEYD